MAVSAAKENRSALVAAESWAVAVSEAAERKATRAETESSAVAVSAVDAV
jgi:hypothetical protein